MYINQGFDTGDNCGFAFYDGPNHSYCGTSRCGKYMLVSSIALSIPFANSYHMIFIQITIVHIDQRCAIKMLSGMSKWK